MDFYGYEVKEDGTIVGKRGEVRTTFDNGRGYLCLNLLIGGVRKFMAVHRVVALCYVSNPLGLPEVDHIDGNKKNNHFSNLRWVSRGENIKHSYLLGGRSASGEQNSRALLTEQDVHDICFLLESGFKASCIRDCGYPYESVRGIKARKNWKFITQHYFF